MGTLHIFNSCTVSEPESQDTAVPMMTAGSFGAHPKLTSAIPLRGPSLQEGIPTVQLETVLPAELDDDATQPLAHGRIDSRLARRLGRFHEAGQNASHQPTVWCGPGVDVEQRQCAQLEALQSLHTFLSRTRLEEAFKDINPMQQVSSLSCGQGNTSNHFACYNMGMGNCAC